MAFWRIFGWKDDLKKLNLGNRTIIQIANLRLIYIFLGMSFICFYIPEDLVHTNLGRILMYGMSGFWLGRMIEQFIFLRVSHWMVHLLTVLFLIGVLLFLLPLYI
jgi:FtsH-binding integral membrane protein